MAKKKRFNKCVVTEKDIEFTVVYEIHQGYCCPNGKQTKAKMKKWARSAFEEMRFIKGHSPKLTEWHPITKSDGDIAFATAKYVFKCGLSTLKKFFYNVVLEFDGNTMGIITDEGHIPDAYAFSNTATRDYVSGYDIEWFEKRFGKELGKRLFDGQLISWESAYVGVSIPTERLKEAIESSFKKKLEDITNKKMLSNIQLNIDKLETAYTSSLEWIKEMSDDPAKRDEPIKSFSIDFREQDLFA